MQIRLIGLNLSYLRYLTLVLALTASCIAQTPAGGASSTPSEPYIGAGRMELALSGQLNIPQTGLGGGTILNIGAAVGRYVAQSSLVGVTLGVVAAWQPGGANSQQEALSGHYRYLFHTHNPKVFPFLGFVPGVNFQHSAMPSNTSTFFRLTAEAGVKCFIARNVSLEPAYNFVYVGSYQALGTLSVPSSTESLLDIGLAFTL